MNYYGTVWSYGKNDQLEHFGIKGQKWGIRRYQNEDGTLTDAGKKRYGASLDEVRSNMEEAKRKETKLRRKSERINARLLFTTDIARSRARKKAAKAGKKAAEIEGVYERMKKGEEASSSGKTGASESKEETRAFEDRNGNGRVIKFDRFDEKKARKIQNDYPDEKELKANNKAMKDIFKSLGYDLNKGFSLDSEGKRSESDVPFDKKSDAEQLYLMLCLGESLGLMSIPKDFWDN